MTTFKGFDPAGLTFLQQLSQNNNKAWFEAHREIYQQSLLTPFRQLVDALAQDMIAIDETLEVTPAVGKTLSRIHRDTRFSRDKSPYRSNLWLTFKRSRKNWTDAPVWFFEFGSDWWRYGLGYYSASRTTMDLFRHKLDEDPEGFLAKATGLPPDFTLQGDSYKRPLVKGMSDELARWYNKKTWAVICDHQEMDALFSPDLVATLSDGFRRLTPLYDMLILIEAEKRLLAQA